MIPSVLRVRNGGVQVEEVSGGSGKVDRGGKLVGEVVFHRGHVIAGVVGALNVDMSVETCGGVRFRVLLMIPVNLIVVDFLEVSGVDAVAGERERVGQFQVTAAFVAIDVVRSGLHRPAAARVKVSGKQQVDIVVDGKIEA